MSLVDLYDHELEACQKVAEELQAKSQGRPRDMEAFRKEIIGRFEEIGIVVEPKVWTVGINGVEQAGVYGFEVEIVDRISKAPFDRERQGWEVRRDILGLGAEPIKDPGDSAALRQIVDAHKKSGGGHSH